MICDLIARWDSEESNRHFQSKRRLFKKATVEEIKVQTEEALPTYRPLEQMVDANFLLKVPFKVKLAPGERLVILRNHVSLVRFTLIQGFLGHLNLVEGNFAYGGQVGYLPKIPFLRHDTVRNNILFGLPLD